MMVVATFLPLVEPTGAFAFVRQNTLIQHGGWLLVGVAISIAAGAVRSFLGRLSWGWPFAASLAAAAGVLIWATNESLRTLYPINTDGTPDTSSGGSVGAHGIAIYVAGVAAALVISGTLMLRDNAMPVRGGKKKCPDCAETVHIDAMVCKHCRYRFPEELDEPEPAEVDSAARKVRCHECYSLQTVPAGIKLTTCEHCEATMKIPRKAE